MAKWQHLTLLVVEKLYKGLNSAQLESSDTTRYKWSFAKNLNKMEMDTIRDNVDSMTSQSRGDDRVAGKRRAQAVGPTMPDTVGMLLFKVKRVCFFADALLNVIR